MSITDTSTLLRLSLPLVTQPHPKVVCFLFPFGRTLQGSLVPYYSLNTCLANLTPDVMYPVIRCPVHLVANPTWSFAFDISFCLYEASALVHLRSTHRIRTCRNRSFRFSLSLTTHSLRNTQHKAVWQLLLKAVAERPTLICNKASTFQRTVVQVTPRGGGFTQAGGSTKVRAGDKLPNPHKTVCGHTPPLAWNRSLGAVFF